MTRRASRSAPTGSLMCCSTCRRSASVLVKRLCTLDSSPGAATRRAARGAHVLQHLPSRCCFCR